MPGKSIESGNVRIPFEVRYEHFTIPEPNSGCVFWLGPLSWNGYGKIKIGYKSEGTRRTAWAHRVAYEYFIGPIPAGMDLDHKCRVRCCVNPNHLEPVTRKENTRRGMLAATIRAKNAAVTHCKNGHLLSGENLYVNSGHRVCRTCKIAWSKAYDARKI